MANKETNPQKPLKETSKKSAKKETKNPSKISKPKKPRSISIKEKAFAREYVKHGNATEAIKKAGFKVGNDNSASTKGHQLLQRIQVQKEIQRLMGKKEEKAIASAADVMEFFTRCMLGEEKDQFGLDISAADKIKAAIELAKRTVDIDNRVKGIPDQAVTIKVDWQQ